MESYLISYDQNMLRFNRDPCIYIKKVMLKKSKGDIILAGSSASSKRSFHVRHLPPFCSLIVLINLRDSDIEVAISGPATRYYVSQIPRATLTISLSNL